MVLILHHTELSEQFLLLLFVAHKEIYDFWSFKIDLEVDVHEQIIWKWFIGLIGFSYTKFEDWKWIINHLRYIVTEAHKWFVTDFWDLTSLDTLWNTLQSQTYQQNSHYSKYLGLIETDDEDLLLCLKVWMKSNLYLDSLYKVKIGHFDYQIPLHYAWN